jgi:hypothetical protein
MSEPVYQTLDEVPWNTVTAVTGPSGNAVGIDAEGFAVWLTGPRSGQRIPPDANGPWSRVWGINQPRRSSE